MKNKITSKMADKTFKEIIEKTKEIIREFEKRQRKKWTGEIIITELTKQIGEVSRQIMALEKNYMPEMDNNPAYQYSKEKLEDGLSDVLFVLIRLAEHYNLHLDEIYQEDLKHGKELIEKMSKKTNQKS